MVPIGVSRIVARPGASRSHSMRLKPNSRSYIASPPLRLAELRKIGKVTGVKSHINRFIGSPLTWNELLEVSGIFVCLRGISLLAVQLFPPAFCEE
jgi:hypothetical protein